MLYTAHVMLPIMVGLIPNNFFTDLEKEAVLAEWEIIYSKFNGGTE